MERSLVLVKPDGVQRALIGEVISRLERRGLRLAAAKFIQVSRELAETHYAIHKGKPFYDGLIAYIISAPVMAMVWEGPNAVAAIRHREDVVVVVDLDHPTSPMYAVDDVPGLLDQAICPERGLLFLSSAYGAVHALDLATGERVAEISTSTSMRGADLRGARGIPPDVARQLRRNGALVD